MNNYISRGVLPDSPPPRRKTPWGSPSESVTPRCNIVRFFSWNVNGLRAVLKKGALQRFIDEYQPDILCLQEIKAKPEQVDYNFEKYQVFWNPAKRPGYSGTAILVRDSLTAEELKLCASKDSEEDGGFYKLLDEGRVQVLDFSNFYLVNVYTPNSKPDLSRLNLRYTEWDPEFLNLLKKLEKAKPVVTCGDFNAAHEEIDLARPNSNHRSAGFTDEERQGVSNLTDAGFIDTFRDLHPGIERYTWWSHWGDARANNVGWRIDYFFISRALRPDLESAEIYESVMGSDHCPISIGLEFDGANGSADKSSANRGNNNGSV